MKELQNRIQQMLREKKTHSRAVALITALSLLMMIIVPDLSVIPGVAMTFKELETATVEAANTAYFENVQESPLGDNLSGKITGISIISDGIAYDGSPITVPAGYVDPCEFSLGLAYKYDNAQLQASGILDSHCVYYEVPPGTVNIKQDYFGAGQTVIDESWSNTEPSGYFSVSTSGLIVIRFTDDYISYLSKSQDGFNGTIRFKANVRRNDTADGDQKFTLEGQEVTFEFPDEKLSISKDGTSNRDDAGQYIQWTISINNPNGHIDLSEYALEDVIQDGVATVDWASKVTDVTVRPADAAVKGENGFVLSGKAPQVTITYKQRAESGHSYQNEARLKKTGEDDIPAKKTVSIENALEANKSGTPDYNIPGMGEGKKIRWTINVQSKSGDSLDMTKITDAVDFPDNTKVYYYNSANQLVELDESLYNKSGNELKLSGESVPSRVQIVYDTDVTGSFDASGKISVSNSCTVESTKTETDNPPDADEDTVSVDYEHQYTLGKTVSMTDTVNDKVQWKIVATANKDGSNAASSATLNGYEITDEAIKGYTYHNNDRNGSYISFNAFTDGGATNITDQVELVKDEASDKVTVKLKDSTSTTPISRVEIFYMQDIKDNENVDTAAFAAYTAGAEATVMNSASGVKPGSGKGETVGPVSGTVKKRIESSKRFMSNPNEKVIGNADKKDRILEWKVNLTNDSGFRGTASAVTDLLQSDGGGQHYIQPSQAASIKLMGKTTDSGDETELTGSAYKIHFYDEQGQEIEDFANGSTNAVKFVVEFLDTIPTDIRYISMSYKTTANVSAVANGSTAHFNNALSFHQTEPTVTKGLIFEREDPNNVKNVTFTVKKTWDDSNNKYGVRPENYQVQIWRAEVDANGQSPAADDATAWTLIKGVHSEDGTYTIRANETSKTLEDTFPQWVVKTDSGGNESVVRYCYKIVEVLTEDMTENGYYISDISAPIVTRNENEDLRLTNKKDQEMTKSAVDKDGNEIKEIDLSKVPKVKMNIGGTETDCYMFCWKIYFNEKEKLYTDTLPPSAIYISGSEEGMSQYVPRLMNSGGWYPFPIYDYDAVISASGTTLTINNKRPDVYKTFQYYTAIPASQIDTALQAGMLTNSVKEDGSDKEVKASLTVNKDVVDDTKYLDKGTIPTIVGGTMKYYMDINPTAKKLSNDGYVTITDQLTIDSTSTIKTPDKLKLVLDDIKVYPYVNGVLNKVDPIEDFSYTVEYDYADSTELSFSEAKDGSLNGGAVKYWNVSGWKSGETVTVRAEKNPAYTSNQSNLTLNSYKAGVNGQNFYDNQLQSVAFSGFDNNGYATATITLPEDAEDLVVVSGSMEVNRTVNAEGDNFLASGIDAAVNGNPLTATYMGSTYVGSVTNPFYYELDGWQPGDTVTITLNENPDFVPSNQAIGVVGYYVYKTSDYNHANLDDTWDGSDSKALVSDKEWNFQNSKTWTINIPNNAEKIVVYGSNMEKSFTQTSTEYSTLGDMSGFTSAPPVPAVLNVEVPDQQYVRVEYTYYFTGYDEDTSEEGQQENGDKIYLSNTASFEEDNGDGWDNEDHAKLNVKEASATSEANKFPKIYKVDVNNYSINTLGASFKVAKYDTNAKKWVYASEVTAEQNGSKWHRSFTFPTDTSNYQETTSNGGTYPPDAVAVLTLAKDDDPTTNDRENVHEFDLDVATLYKFVETRAPEGYTQPKTNGSLEENSDFVYYYAYNGYSGDIPADAKDDTGKSKVHSVAVNGTLNIPNVQSISIKAQKIFTGKDLPDSATVNLKLYYSKNRAGTNLKPVTADLIGADANVFQNPIELAYNKTTSPEPIAEWTGLPSGMNGTPVYYFVQEESFTYGGKTYKLNETSQKFQSGETVCNFQPVYTRNGANQDGTIIQVNNSQGIQVKKTWVDRNGKTVDPPKMPDESHGMDIRFEIYAQKGNYRVKLDLTDAESTLKEVDGYKLFLPNPVKIVAPTSSTIRTALEYTEGKQYELSYFDSYTIEEKLTAGQTEELYGKYGNPKSTGMIQNGTGILELINTDIRSDTVSLEAQKVWDDNGADHSEDSITLKLVQSTNANLNTTDLIAIANGETITKDHVEGEHIRSSRKVLAVPHGGTNSITFTKDIKGVTVKNEGTLYTSYSGATLTVLNSNPVGSSIVTVTFEDDSEQDITVTVFAPELTLSSAGSWKASWESLPTVDDNGNSYYYYVCEKSVPENYEVSYSKASETDTQEMIVTNRLPTTLTVNKEWYAGSMKIDNPETYPGLPNKITVDVYQRYLNEEKVEGEDVPKPASMKVIALGDSITNGSYEGKVAEPYRYWYRLREKLQGGGYNSASVVNHGVDGNEINDMLIRLPNIDFTGVSAVTLIAGTNDVMHGKSEGAASRYKQLVEAIYAKAQAANIQDFTVYAATIPNITKLEWFQYPDENPTQARADELVSNYNTAISNLMSGGETGDIVVPEGYSLVKVDLNSAVKVTDTNHAALGALETMLVDGCHPNEKGYEAIAKAFYSAINSHYTSATITTITNPTNVDMPSASADINTLATGTLYGTYDLLKSNGYQLELKNLPKADVLGEQYVYYIREKGTHATNGTSYRLTENALRYIAGVQYVANGMTAVTNDSMTIRNTIKTTDLHLEKQWSDGNDTHSGDTITVKIHRESLADSSAAKQNTLTLTLNKEEETIVLGKKNNAVLVNATVPVKSAASSTEKLDVAFVDSAQQQIRISPKEDAAPGDYTITFTSEDGQTAELTVHVVEKPPLTLVLSGNSDPVIGGVDPAPTVERVEDIEGNDVKKDATYASSNQNVIRIDESTGEMTVVGVGAAEITASYDGKTTPPQTVEVLYSDDFTVAESLSIKTGTAVSLEIDPYFGEFEYPVVSGLTFEDGKVTATKAGTYTVTIKRKDNIDSNKWTSKEVTINAEEAKPEGTLDSSYGSVIFDTNRALDNLVLICTDYDSWGEFRLKIKDALGYTSLFRVGFYDGENNAGNILRVDSDYNPNNFIITVNDDNTTPPPKQSLTIEFPENFKAESIVLEVMNASQTMQSVHYELTYAASSTDQSNANSLNTTTPTRTLQTRFSSKTLRMGAALNYTALEPDEETEELLTAGAMKSALKGSAMNLLGSTLQSATFEEDGYIIRTISADSWKLDLSDLPVYNASGSTVETYYYWAEEIDGADGYKASYAFKDGDEDTDYSINAANSGAALISILNTKNTPPDAEASTLPETGGRGTAMYYTIGGLLLMLGAVGYVTIRRRRWSDG